MDLSQGVSAANEEVNWNWIELKRNWIELESKSWICQQFSELMDRDIGLWGYRPFWSEKETYCCKSTDTLISDIAGLDTKTIKQNYVPTNQD